LRLSEVEHEHLRALTYHAEAASFVRETVPSALCRLVPRHRGFDRLGLERRERVSWYTQVDAAGLPRNPTDETAALKLDDHSMN